MKDDLKPLVSIIIPVYNTEEYLDKCLRSAVEQRYRNLEIIVVNDGSTDKSSDIIAKYVSVDPRIIRIDKRNEGLVEARKSGLDVASGKYIQYLDGDDMLRENVIESLVEKAEETNADIVVAPFFWSIGDRLEKSAYQGFESCTGLNFLKKALLNEAYWCVWSKFHLRSLYFDIERPKVSFGEDVILSTQLLIHAQKVVSIDVAVINYTDRPTSISHHQNFSEKVYDDFIAYTQWVKLYIEKKELSQSLNKEMSFFHLQNIFRKIEWGKLRDASEDMKKAICDLRVYPEMIGRFSRRKRKIIAVYKISNFLGYLNLLRYKKQRKL